MPLDDSPVGRLARAFVDVVNDPPATAATSWDFLRDARGLVPWMSTSSAAHAAERTGLALWGARPDIARKVHDKAFAVRFVDDNSALTDLVVVLGPDDVVDGDAIEARVSRWPSWTAGNFTLKPRWGTSGRGRVAGRNGKLDDVGRRSLARLRERGGAILEPWLARTLDLSSQWHVSERGDVVLLGVTQQIVRPSGVWLGCARASTAWDSRAADGGRRVVEAARAEGYVGVCGVDSFVWRIPGDSRDILRSVVELNARFTGGTIGLAVMAKTGATEFRLDG